MPSRMTDSSIPHAVDQALFTNKAIQKRAVGQDEWQFFQLNRNRLRCDVASFLSCCFSPCLYIRAISDCRLLTLDSMRRLFKAVVLAALAPIVFGALHVTP